jgi:hypothetical protein
MVVVEAKYPSPLQMPVFSPTAQRATAQFVSIFSTRALTRTCLMFVRPSIWELPVREQ